METDLSSYDLLQVEIESCSNDELSEYRDHILENSPMSAVFELVQQYLMCIKEPELIAFKANGHTRSGWEMLDVEIMWCGSVNVSVENCVSAEIAR